ncbi:MAG: XRE family transcriptional regulator [Clostridia bacterium]|nr:XRE family transcriptional regulator [Clostridia bacterium]
MYYNERLLFLRQSKELTQEEISNAIGIKRQQYRRYEAGINLLPITHLKALCEIYGVSADYILGLPQNLDYPKR